MTLGVSRPGVKHGPRPQLIVVNNMPLMTSTASTRSTAYDHDTVLQGLLADVVASWQPLAVYVYEPRGETRCGVGADYDLLVVVADDADAAALDVVCTQDDNARVRVAADIVPTTCGLFLARRADVATLEGLVFARGVLLYGGV